MYSNRERRPWSVEEDELLCDAVLKEDPTRTFNPSKWHAIARHLPSRNNKDCRKRWFSKLAKADVARGNWSADEDERLKHALHQHGRKWTIIAQAVQTRNSDQCAKRWKDTLDPSINKAEWTEEEVPSVADVNLINAVKTHGTVWAKIVKAYFPNRTGLAAKNRYHSITRVNIGLPRLPSPTASLSDASQAPSNLGSSSVSPNLSPSYMTDGSSPTSYDLSASSLSWDADGSSFTNHLVPGPLETLALANLFSLPPMEGMSSPPMQQNSSQLKLMTLYGKFCCANTARVEIVLQEIGIPYELIIVDNMSDSDLQSHPFSETPVLVDDGFTLYESRAMCRYLATKYAGRGARLIPDAFLIQSGALFEQAVFTEVFAFEPYASKAVYEKVTKPSKGLPTDEADFQGSIAVLSSKLDNYEQVLSRQSYLAGEELTLADLHHIPCGAMLAEAGCDIMIRKGSNITRWWTEISSRPSWIAVRSGKLFQR
ncbi:hypothetical protein D9757_005822 [Collybiopsis confluens]|uniref:Glutathione S-transferase n=1 Tax=Collybiopsis confluens TaxID=2823264 RepID=A0A8H5HN62_9AGAR|nr:hypothetical protein D9757_005822 [Collybiopsis confluens]